MKKLILDALTTKFEGVSSKILEGIAEKLSKTVTSEAEIAAAVEGVTFQSVLESYGDQRATSASVTAVKNYETKHNLKDGKPVEVTPPVPPVPPTPPVPPVPPKAKEQEEVPEYIKAILESNKKLTETVNSLQGEITTLKTNKVAETRRSMLDGLISKLSPAQQNPYKRIKLESMSEDEFNAFVDEVKGDVAAFEKEAPLSFGAPFVGGSGKQGKASEAEINEVVDKIF